MKDAYPKGWDSSAWTSINVFCTDTYSWNVPGVWSLEVQNGEEVVDVDLKFVVNQQDIVTLILSR